MIESELGLVFARIPLLAGRRPEEFEITRLAGYTNENYRIRCSERDWVLRIPRASTNRYIDRAAEAHNQRLAHQLDLAPAVTWSSDDGLSLTPTLRRSRGVIAADLASEEMLRIIVAPLRKLHRSGLQFRGRVNLDASLTRLFELLDSSQQQRMLPRLRQARRILKLLESRDQDYVASHNDLVLGNLLLQQSRLCLIDWEYSAMASPYWDLATLCNAANLDLEQSQLLLACYCADGVPMEESLLFDYRGLLRLLSDCWMMAFADKRPC